MSAIRRLLKTRLQSWGRHSCLPHCKGLGAEAQRPLPAQALFQLPPRSALCLALLAAAAAAQRPACAPFDAAARQRVVSYLAARFHFQNAAVADVQQVPGTCYVRLDLTVPNPDRRYVFYLAPDRRYLTAAIYDLDSPPAPPNPDPTADLAREPSPARGPAAAPIVIVEFSDFECPFCARLSEYEAALPAAERSRIRTVFKFFPLSSIHPWAQAAAEAAACVYFQSPPAFWKVHDYLFQHQSAQAAESVAASVEAAAAAAPGFDRARYQSCLALRKSAGIVARDRALGQQLGVTGTPTLFINGRRYVGMGSAAAFARDLAAAAVAKPVNPGPVN